MEPLGLNPILSTRSASRYVWEQIFQTLNAQDPQSFELRPALASVPTFDSLETGGMVYHYVIDSAATWPNGSPVLASDVVFSLKALLNPLVPTGPYRPYYTMIRDIKLDSADQRKLSFITKYTYLLATQAIGDLVVYPEYAYDPDGLMRSVSLTQLTDPEVADSLEENSWEVKEFAKRFKNPEVTYDPELIVGSGPYELVSWEPGQELRLSRRSNYWALDREEPWLKALPEELTYLIIPDNSTVANALRDRVVDVVVDMPTEQFRLLRDDEYLRQFYDFSTVLGFKYYSILLNQSDPLMSDSLTRRAFAHTVDVEMILQRLLPDLAERTNGPAIPSRSYYNHDLPDLPYDIERARELLAEAGWEDVDGDGIVERESNGKQVKLSFNLLTPPGPSNEDVSIVAAEGARKAGIDINVIKMEATTLQNRLSAGNFVACMYGLVVEPGPDDFTQVWSSTAVPPSGTNRGYFKNAEADDIMRKITTTMDAKSRYPLYRRFQEIVYENQPMIFLYAPYDRIVISKLLDYTPTSLSPNLNFNALQAFGPPDSTRVIPTI